MSQIKFRKERFLVVSRLEQETNTLNSPRASLVEIDNQNKVFRLLDNNIQQLHTSIVAAAVAGKACSLAPIALPLTKKNITGFSIGSSEKSPRLIMDDKLLQGFMTIQPLSTGGEIFRARTSYLGSSPVYQEPSIQRTSDHLSKTLRILLEQQFVGQNITNQLKLNVQVAINEFLARSLDIIYSGSLVQCEVDKIEPRQLNITIEYKPLFPLNQFNIQVSLSTQL